jgi:hypothetical protein
MSSEVVGSCSDCIISVPNASPLSLKFKVDIQEGINHLIKHRGLVNGYYPTTTGLSVQQLTIAESGSYSPGQTCSALILSTNSPIQLTLVNGGISMTVTVNQLFIIDSPFTSFSLTNPSTTEQANVVLGFTL